MNPEIVDRWIANVGYFTLKVLREVVVANPVILDILLSYCHNIFFY